jgi:HAD superfamily hydrolase (TIGR01509 family)
MSDGSISARPGIVSLIDECFASGIVVAVVSNSNKAMVETVVRSVLGESRFKKIPIFSSDIDVPIKPFPDLYNFAAQSIGVENRRCFVVEDSEMGLKAALAANMKTIITVSTFTRNENFEGSKLVVDNLEMLPTCGECSLDYIDSLYNSH